MISMIVMSILLIGGMLLFLHFFSGVTMGSFDLSEKGNLEKTFENEDYFYYTTTEEINEAIEKAINSLELIENNILLSESLEKNEDIAFAYLETPYLTALKESRAIYDHFSRVPATEEIKNLLSDSYLPIHIRFHGNRGYVYEITMTQFEEEIKPIHTETRGGGTIKTIYISVDDIDLTAPAAIRVEDYVNPSISVDFKIDFDDYK